MNEFRKSIQESLIEGRATQIIGVGLGIEISDSVVITDEIRIPMSITFRHVIVRRMVNCLVAYASGNHCGLARIIHDGSRRNCGVALRDGRVELRGREAYLKQYVDRPSSEPARLRAETPHASLSQQRIGNCSRSVHE